MNDWIEFILGETFLALRRNMLFTLAAITTVALALFLIGAFGYTYYQTDRYIHALPTRLEMRVFLKDEVSDDDAAKLAETIKGLPGEVNATFISKADAWAKMRADHPDYPSDLENPLPDAYSVRFDSVQAANGGADVLNADAAVDKVVYLKDLAKQLQQALSVIRYVGYGGFVLLAIGGVIIFNAIQLTVVARRREVRIMQLVGASAATIRVPFVLEGTIHGLLGGIVAAGILAATNAGIGRAIAGLGHPLPPYPWAPVSALIVLAGIAIGLICSTVATRALVRA